MKWQELTLGQGIHIKHGYAFKGEFFSDSGEYIVLTPGNFYEVGGFRYRPGKDRFYSGDIPEKFILAKDDLIVAMTEQGEGLLGSSALIPEDNKFLHNQRLGLINYIDPSIFDNFFLYYLFNTRSVRYQISGSASGTKVRHTSPDRIYRVSVRVPDVKTQQKIADILSKYDDLIENNRRRIEGLEESARLLYREWFVYLRFPGHEHTPIIDGIPEGWEKKKLEKLVHINSSSLTNSFQGEVQYVEISSVSPGSINEITKYNFQDAPSRARRIVKHGDIIWSCVRPNRKSHAIIWNPTENLIVSTGFAVITPCKASTGFLYQTLTTPDFVGYLSQNARGTSYPAVTASDFANATIIYPKSSLIKAFDDVVKPTIEQINILQQQSKKLAEARDILLPRLMNGEITV